MLYNNEKLSQYEKRHSVFLSIQAFICILGIVCNILAIFVFERKQLKKHSYSFYWRLKAYFDSWLLLCIFLHWVKHFLNIDIDHCIISSMKYPEQTGQLKSVVYRAENGI